MKKISACDFKGNQLEVFFGLEFFFFLVLKYNFLLQVGINGTTRNEVTAKNNSSVLIFRSGLVKNLGLKTRNIFPAT